MLPSSFSAAPTLVYLSDGLFVLTKLHDQPNREAQLLAARLKRWLRLILITMPPSLWPSLIVGWLLRLCYDGGKDKDTGA